ncbi:glycosyltransferase [Flaviflexus salsibiostraticola]|uniref:Glycosyltransferase n=1 Tax=Flaviflexus salsibiostraticola TaxID=1282737 RepID=A0A3S8Z694_9ACTO|nr:glycosyltransferase [Flaviflexus salsibiostraticola]AZN29017.1 glycosyltransferase [Flaviflexus salsibiostraticola]
MRIIVCPHELAMGGSQMNAIELAAAVRDRGHEVVIYASAGALADRVDELGLELVTSPAGNRLSLAWARGLIALTRSFEPDLIHTYEWAPSLGAAYGVRQLLATPQIMTVLSMDVPDFLPADVPLIVGTRALAAQIQWHDDVYVMEPPIDTDADRTGDVEAARRRLGMPADALIISVVCRMTDELGKASGVEAAIDAVSSLAGEFPIRLLVVGDGPALSRIRERAERVNAQAGRLVVECSGQMNDASDAYESADVVVGMGSSILRAMSFGKPVIVQGDTGFTRLLTPETVDEFLWRGFYGIGGNGAADLIPALRSVLSQPSLRSDLSAWNRDLVTARFSLSGAADTLERLYRRVADVPHRRAQSTLSLSQSLARLAKFHISRAVRTRIPS